MCIALPMKIVAVADPDADPARRAVLVQGPDGAREEASAALLDGVALPALIGRWAVVHTGFILTLMDADDARSRLAVFAAMRGEAVDPSELRPPPLDLDAAL